MLKERAVRPWLVIASLIGGCDADATDSGQTESLAEVAGYVVDDADGSTVAGATVRIVGTDVSTVSEASGAFSLQTAPGLVAVHADDGDNWGIVEVFVIAAGERVDTDLEIYPNEFIDRIGTGIEAVPDPTRGVIAVLLDGVGGGERVSISASDGAAPFVLGFGDAASPGDTLPPEGGLPGFLNVPSGTTTVDVTAPAGRSCALAEPAGTEYPVVPRAVTLLVGNCE